MDKWRSGEIERKVAMFGEEWREMTDDKALKKELKKRKVAFPIEDEPRIPTMDKPLIIESACPGGQVGGSRFPAVPITFEDQVKEITESIKAGAVAIHVHPRDPVSGIVQYNPLLLQEVLDNVFANVGDCVTLNHSWIPIHKGDVDYLTDTKELLELGEGNKYIQGSVILPVGRYSELNSVFFSDETTRQAVEWMEANGVKPIYQLYDTFNVFHFSRYFADGTSTWKPYVLNLNLGKHHSHSIHKDPWSYLQLITNVNMVKETVPESIIGVYPGGRNWLPMLVMGIMMGADIVRVGIEDCYWMYPHKDELIKKNSDTVKLAVEVANILGREVVTDPDKARKILGMKLTSKL